MTSDILWEMPMSASPQDSQASSARNAIGSPDRSYALPPLGDNPSTERQGTTPGSFALPGRVGTAYTYSSPDTPGMPGVSDKTAWDFLPSGWSSEVHADPAVIRNTRT